MDGSAKTPELLAPAGDWDCVRAAVANGADAVYFGLDQFSARARAANFAATDLPELLVFLHRHNVRGYVALNTLIFPDECDRVAELLLASVRAGVDAIIVQDLGLLALARHLAPTLRVHASTQTTQTEASGLDWLRTRGVSRAILARELSLAEIAALAAQTTLELEVFVHGALCISYSGQCLASEALWGRSGNRGACAQACRLPYELVIDGQLRRAPSAPYHPLSPHDLAAIELIPDLVRLGIAAVKIEGRLKSPHYVAAVVRLYRAALDAAARGELFTLTPEHQAQLAQVFSRGFTPGFLAGIDHQRLIDGRSPKARGRRLGAVVARAARGLVVELAEMPGGAPPLQPGDGVVFENGRGEAHERGGRVRTVAPHGEARRVLLTFAREDLDPAAVELGSSVWKTDDPQLRRMLEQTYSRVEAVHRIPLDVEVTAACGRPLQVRVQDAAGYAAEVHADTPLEQAEHHPLTPDLLRAQFERLRETPFELRNIDLHGAERGAPPDPVLAPRSLLNELRRRSVAALLEQRTACATHVVARPDALAQLRAELAGAHAGAHGPRAVQPMLSVLVRTQAQCAAVLDWNAARPAATSSGFEVVLDLLPGEPDGSTLDLVRRSSLRAVLATPRIIHPQEHGRLRQLIDLRPDALLVRNLAALAVCRTAAPELALEGDASLNVTNELAGAELLRAGLQRLTPGHDLDLEPLCTLLQQLPADCCTIVLHQRMPLFHTRHCLFAAGLSDGPNCGACGWPCRGHSLALRDRLGFEHPVVTDVAGCNTVFNARVQSAAEMLPNLRAAGARHFRIELFDETPGQIEILLKGYAALLAGDWLPHELLARLRPFYSAGLYAGTLAHGAAPSGCRA